MAFFGKKQAALATAARRRQGAVVRLLMRTERAGMDHDARRACNRATTR